MANTFGSVTILPQGQSVAYTLLCTSGRAPTCYSDMAGGSTVSNTGTVTVPTTLYVDAPDQYSLSLKINGAECSTATGRLRLFSLDYGKGVIVEPTLPEAESAPAASGTYAPIRSANRLAGEVALAEAAVAAGTVPPRMSPAPTIIFSKGSGITGTPTVSAGGAGYVVGDQITLTGGTSLSAAILQVTTVSGGAVTAVSVIRNGVYTVTPSNPVAQGSTTAGGSGATFTVAWSVNGATTALSRAKVAATDARMRFTGPGPITNEGSSGYYGGAVNSVHTTFEWSTDSQRLDLNLVGLNTSGVLYVEGKQVDGTARATDASGSRYTYSVDLGSSVMRTFKWVAFNQGFDGVWVDGTATVVAPQTVTRPLVWVLGDSYTGATGADNAASQHVMVMGDYLGLDVLADGIGGTGWNSTGGNTPSTRVSTRLGVLTRVPQYVFYDLGYNDAGGSMTTAASAFDAAHTAALTAAPSAKFFCFGPATPLGRTTNLDAVRDMLIARCAAWGITFVDVGDWVNSTNKTTLTGVDNIHPNARGHKYLGARRAETIRPLL